MRQNRECVDFITPSGRSSLKYLESEHSDCPANAVENTKQPLSPWIRTCAFMYYFYDNSDTSGKRWTRPIQLFELLPESETTNTTRSQLNNSQQESYNTGKTSAEH